MSDAPEIVVAMARGGAIGRANALPWRLPEDLRHFRALTTGHAVVMGRRTWDSIGRPLPGRTSIVVTRDPVWLAAGALRAGGLEEGLRLARAAHPGRPPMVIGGAQVYEMALDLAAVLHVTRIEFDVPGADAFFPAIDPSRWREESIEAHVAADGTQFAFQRLVRA
ncbi:MAG: dihydrofolate reductase [Alphaproteobacteria bacterium]